MIRCIFVRPVFAGRTTRVALFGAGPWDEAFIGSCRDPTYHIVHFSRTVKACLAVSSSLGLAADLQRFVCGCVWVFEGQSIILVEHGKEDRQRAVSRRWPAGSVRRFRKCFDGSSSRRRYQCKSYLTHILLIEIVCSCCKIRLVWLSGMYQLPPSSAEP